MNAPPIKIMTMSAKPMASGFQPTCEQHNQTTQQTQTKTKQKADRIGVTVHIDVERNRKHEEKRADKLCDALGKQPVLLGLKKQRSAHHTHNVCSFTCCDAVWWGYETLPALIAIFYSCAATRTQWTCKLTGRQMKTGPTKSSRPLMPALDTRVCAMSARDPRSYNEHFKATARNFDCLETRQKDSDCAN